MQDQAKTRLAHLQSCLAQERRWFEEDIDRLKRLMLQTRSKCLCEI